MRAHPVVLTCAGGFDNCVGRGFARLNPFARLAADRTRPDRSSLFAACRCEINCEMMIVLVYCPGSLAGLLVFQLRENPASRLEFFLEFASTFGNKLFEDSDGPGNVVDCLFCLALLVKDQTAKSERTNQIVSELGSPFLLDETCEYLDGLVVVSNRVVELTPGIERESAVYEAPGEVVCQFGSAFLFHERGEVRHSFAEMNIGVLN